MSISHFRRAAAFAAAACLVTFLAAVSALSQDNPQRGRKYVAPPATAHVSVSVIKDANGKPVENAAVVFHMVGEEGKGNMELKTNEEGRAVIDVIPIGDTVRLQVVATGYQTYGEDYKIGTDSREIVVRLKRPTKQYSTYDHPDSSSSQQPASSAPATTPKPGDSQPQPK